MLQEIKGGVGDLFHMSAPLTPVAPRGSRSSDVSLEDTFHVTRGDLFYFILFWGCVAGPHTLLFCNKRKCLAV